MKKILFLLLLFTALALSLAVSISAESGGGGGGGALLYILVSLFVGLLTAGLCLFFMYRSMSTVRKQKKADSYVDAGSFFLSESRDVFLYSRISRIRISSSSDNKR